MAKLYLKEEAYAVQGAIFEVYKTIGTGFLESVYQECLAEEFRSRRIPYREQPELKIHYKGTQIRSTFRPDFICYDAIIIELKAVNDLLPIHQAQLINYLRITGMKVGLLINFHSIPKVEIKRIVR